MAKKSVIARQNKRQRMVDKYAARRASLKLILRDPQTSEEEKWAARHKLQSLPRDSSPVRLQNRCQMTGSARAVYRRVGLRRNEFRKLAMNGEITGLTKASW